MNDIEIRNILWTSGWDSTFRVLYSLIVDKVKVNPIYIIDIQRRSTLNEIKSIMSIVNTFNLLYPNLKDNLKPLTVINTELKEQKEYQNNLRILNTLPVRFGSQHAWLPIVLNEIGSNEKYEISMHDLSKTSEYLKSGYLTKDGSAIRLSDESPEELKVLFSCFYFPVINLSKQDMKKISELNGFYKLMEMTWFCHDPIFNIPCGMCNPCKDARFKYNMSFRLGFTSKYIMPAIFLPRKIVRKIIKVLNETKF